jgi:putative PIN family toxin of toxin-antitoxin system
VRVVLDTNILAPQSWRSEFGQDNLLQLFGDDVDLVVSRAILMELADVLPRPRLQRRHRWDPARVSEFLSRVREDSVYVDPPQYLDVVRDPSDNRILEAALAGQADYIVTTDRDLLDLDEFEGVRIVTPVTFLAILRELNG